MCLYTLNDDRTGISTQLDRCTCLIGNDCIAKAFPPGQPVRSEMMFAVCVHSDLLEITNLVAINVSVSKWKDNIAA